MADWQNVGIELPHGWKDAVARTAREIGCPMRYVWMAALDAALSMPPERLAQMAVAFELMARRDLPGLAATPPGQCNHAVAAWASAFVAGATGQDQAQRAAS